MKRENIMALADSYMNRYTEDYPFSKDTIFAAYVEGASRANYEHAEVWHDVSEEPRCEELLLGEDSDGFSIYRWCGQEDNFEAFVNATGLSRWAYINDLLPKGGE